MRYYRISNMKHAVYDSMDEVPPHINPLKDWRKAKIGDWVIADDESIIQVLRKGIMLRHNGERNYIGTCTGTFLALKDTIMDTDKRKNIYSIGGNATPNEVVTKRRKMTANEELFSTYVSQGISPEDAYVKAFPTNNKRYARMKAINLIKTERVRTAVKKELEPVLDELDIDPKMVLKGIKDEAKTAEKADTRLKALFKLSDILDLEDKNSTKVQQVTGIAFQGLTNDMIDAAERPKEIESE